MEIIGYKVFEKGLKNRYGKVFQVGQEYKVEGKSKFGINGNGFHFCKNFEDCFRYFDTEKETILCEVTATGEISTYNDEYNGYYDMYCATNIRINRIIPRDEIIEMADNLYEERLIRFITTYKLTIDELKYFKEKYINKYAVQKAIQYYYKI